MIRFTYTRNQLCSTDHARLDAVHKARQVGKKDMGQANASNRIKRNTYVPRFMRGIQILFTADQLDAVHKARQVGKKDMGQANASNRIKQNTYVPRFMRGIQILFSADQLMPCIKHGEST